MFRSPTTDLLALLVIVLVIFGPKRLPSLGRQLGRGLRGFKDSIAHGAAGNESEERREIAQASSIGEPPPGPGDGGLGPTGRADGRPGPN